jgi:RNA polymerase sigma-70 factor (ECF subfamily)
LNSGAATNSLTADLRAARRGNEAAFERLIGPHRAQLQAHCYRMLGSSTDSEDALQETLLRAWRGLPSFEGRSSLRSWLYRIATNVCLKMIERRPRRVLPIDYGPPSDPHDRPEGPLVERVWIDPYPDEALGLEQGPTSPEARYEQRESVELAFLAALQHLPGRQRAVLLLRDVLGFSPGEIAKALDATPASISAALQRARRAAAERMPVRSQQATLRSIGDERLREAVERYVRAWERGDVAAVAAMLTDDATFAMPPRPTWHLGRAAVAAFLAAAPLSGRLRWQHVRVRANGQPALALYASRAGSATYSADAIIVLSFDSSAQIASVTAFKEPAMFARFGLPSQMTRRREPR